MFDVGALIFKIQTAGAQVFGRDMADADKAIKKVEGSAKSAKPALDAQGKATDELGAKSRKASEDQKKQTKATEDQVQAAKTLSLALIAGGLAVTAMVGLSVAKFTEFDKAMSNTAAATMATAQEQRALGDAALEAGADTAYSAKEAAAAEEELAKAGQSVSQIVGGSLRGALSLAAAGQLQVARSAEIMATTLTQFRLPAEKAAHVSDVLAAGAGKAQGSVDDLALALSYVGPLAGSVGFSLNETAGTIAYFATQGIIGEKAGTSLRGVLASLQSPSALADKEMKKYSISMFDANGNMLSLAGIAEQLRTKLGGLTQQERLAALGRIFGNESLNAATLLYEGGAEKVTEWTEKVNDSGYAAEQAAMRQDNLAGDVEKLGGAFDTALIKTGSGANDVLREMVQSVTALVDWYGELPAPVQEGALVFGVLTGAILLTSGASLGLVARFSELRKQFELNNISMGKTALIGGAVGLALTGIITVVGLLAQKQAEARQRAQSYADALRDGADAGETMIRNLQEVDNGLFGMQNFGSALDAAEQLGLSFDTVKDAVKGVPDAMAEVDAAVQKSKDGFNQWTGEGKDAYNAATLLEDAVRLESEAYKEGQRLTEQATEATDENAASTQTAAEAYLDAASGAEDLNSQLTELIDTINEANGVGQDAISANLDYQDALAKVDETIQKAKEGQEGYSLTLDQTTQAGRDNLGMLNDMAAKSQEAAEKQFQLDGNTDAYKATLEAGRQALIDRAMDLGYNAEQAGALADQIYRIPSATEWQAIVETQAASQRVDTFIRTYDGRTITLHLTTDQVVVGNRVFGGLRSDQADGSVLKFYGNGGRENHVAQFARAGSWRVWAEPETEGETYIPHAMSKRARSTQILRETANEFGYDLVAKGSMTATPPAQQPIQVDVKLVGPFYSYDPTAIRDEVEQGVSDALDAAGMK